MKADDKRRYVAYVSSRLPWIRKIDGEMKHAFKPEFLNRIDARMVFHSLREDQIRLIVDLMLKRRLEPQLQEVPEHADQPTAVAAE